MPDNALKLLVASLFVALLVACAGPTVQLSMLAPARYAAATTERVVAVLPFDGRQGANVAGQVEAVLVGIEVNGSAYFTVVERSKLNKVVAELEFTQSGLMDTRSAVRIGKMAGAKAIYTGRVDDMDIEYTHYSEPRSECVAYKDSGKLIKECLRKREYSVPCEKRRAVFSMTPKLIAVETGQVIYSRRISREESEERCSDASGAGTADGDLLAKARQAVIDEFARDIAPAYVSESVAIMDSADQLTAAARKKFDSAVEFAKAERYGRACDLWNQANTLNQPRKHPALYYDLGLCAEMDGNLEQAGRRYRQAEQLLDTPQEAISVGIERIERKLEDRRILQHQL